MHSGFIHTAAAGLLLCLAACGKQVPDGADGLPISFRSEVATKALLDTDGLRGETIVVNDVHVDAAGVASRYMKDVPLEYSFGAWSTEPLYYWTKGGSHWFAAHVEGQDVSFTQDGGGRGNDRLCSGVITLSTGNQPDLLYAFEDRDLDNSGNPHAPVPLDFRHALAAVRINITNMKYDEGLAISGYELRNIAAKGSFGAGRDIYDAGGQPEYSLTGRSTGYTVSKDAGDRITVASNGRYTLYSGEGAVGADGSLLVWPQEIADGTEAITLVVTRYYQEDIEIPLSGASVSRWQPGRRYTYDINLADDHINVTATVQPWEINDVIID